MIKYKKYLRSLTYWQGIVNSEKQQQMNIFTGTNSFIICEDKQDIPAVGCIRNLTSTELEYSVYNLLLTAPLKH